MVNYVNIYLNDNFNVSFLQYTSIIILNMLFIKSLKIKCKHVIFAIIYSVFFAILYSIFDLVITLFLWIFLILVNLKITKKINKSLISSSLSILLSILSDYITTLLFIPFKNLAITENSTRFQLYFHVFSSFVILLTLGIIVFRSMKKIIKNKKLTDYTEFIIAVISIFTFIAYYSNIFIERHISIDKITGSINAIILIIYAIISIVLFFIILQMMQKDLESKYREKEFKHLEEYTANLEENYNEMRKFRHDYQNILISLESYIEDKNIANLEEYFHTYIKPTSNKISSNYFKLSQLSNIQVSSVKSIISSKLIYSQELGIDSSFEANELITAINLNQIKLVRSLGILLDNAIEEVKENTKHGYIRVGIINKDTTTIIIVSNSCRFKIKLHEIQKCGFSTKGNKRGLGLSNLKDMLGPEKNVTLETKIENNEFTQIIKIKN